MGLFSVFDISGSGMSAQSVRINASASNLSNAETIASSPEAAYKARYPVFSAIQKSVGGEFGQSQMGVKVENIIESQTPPSKEYRPGHPLADKEGFVYVSNVSSVEEMANMISASRTYQMNVQVMNATKSLLQRTLQSLQ